MFVISIKNTHETSELHIDIPTLIIMVITPNAFEKIFTERQEREKNIYIILIKSRCCSFDECFHTFVK